MESQAASFQRTKYYEETEAYSNSGVHPLSRENMIDQEVHDMHGTDKNINPSKNLEGMSAEQPLHERAKTLSESDMNIGDPT